MCVLVCVFFFSKKKKNMRKKERRLCFFLFLWWFVVLWVFNKMMTFRFYFISFNLFSGARYSWSFVWSISFIFSNVYPKMRQETDSIEILIWTFSGRLMAGTTVTLRDREEKQKVFQFILINSSSSQWIQCRIRAQRFGNPKKKQIRARRITDWKQVMT